MVKERVLFEASKLSVKYFAFVDEEENESGVNPDEFDEDEGMMRD